MTLINFLTTMCRLLGDHTMRDGIKITRKEASLSRTTSIILLGMIAFTFLSLNNTQSIQRALQQNAEENGCLQLPKPSVLSDLLHLYKKLPNATSSKSLPPFREVTYAFPRQREVPPSIITLSTQLTVSRLPRLVQLLERWNGPISCAVYLPDPSAIQALYDFVQAQNKFVRDLVTFHIMLEKPTPYYDYPINRMRNLALLNLDTEHFFNCDVDFIPQVDAHDHLLQFLSTRSNVKEDFKKLYVLPAFEVFGEGDRDNSMVTRLDEVPQDKNELLSMLRAKQVQPFHMDYYEDGHATTDYDKWYVCQNDRIVSYPIEYRWKFEPYIVGNKYGIPTFNERLRGFGLNKASWVAEAHLLGYQFEVLCDHFVVHMNHPGRKGREAGNNSPVIDWYQRTYLSLRYNVTTAQLRKNGNIVQLPAEHSNIKKPHVQSVPVPKRRKRRRRRAKRRQKKKLLQIKKEAP